LLIVRKGEGEVMPVDNEKQCDPRDRLVREKYFCVRPRPLERWFWTKRIPASAERVFWLHWQEGMQRGDWCSELPLSRVARECSLDISTVTRAYQLLARIGCLRRTDPGRDPSNPFQQATAITEVRVPRELLAELDRHPTRRPATNSVEKPQQGRAVTPPAPIAPSPSEDVPPAAPEPADPFSGLTGRERARALSELTNQLSPTERHAYQEALRMHHSHMDFDTNSSLRPEAKAQILNALAAMAAPSDSADQTSPSNHPHTSRPSASARPTQRKLSLFELARLNREIQSAASPTSAPELMRQVMWSIESGALKRFDTRHALHIALKKIREGLWTRPHRMPPNWARTSSTPPSPEACRAA
jgi:hypothetical protein